MIKFKKLYKSVINSHFQKPNGVAHQTDNNYVWSKPFKKWIAAKTAHTVMEKLVLCVFICSVCVSVHSQYVHHQIRVASSKINRFYLYWYSNEKLTSLSWIVNANRQQNDFSHWTLCLLNVKNSPFAHNSFYCKRTFGWDI